MARAKRVQKRQKKRNRGRRRVLPAVLLVCLLAGGFFGWMHLQARLTHLRMADVYLQDLPTAFDGTTILYVSDINIRSSMDGYAAKRLFGKLESLKPDMLLLGGDYSAGTLVDVLNSDAQGDSRWAEDFIASLADFPASLGKFAVAGEQDHASALEPIFARSGVQLLTDACAAVERDGKQLVIAGLSDVSEDKTPYEQIGGYFSGDECVIALAHNPSAYIGIRVAEARGGGAWADMVLSGHTLGGQIRLGNRTLRTFTEAEKRCIGGWYYSDDLPMLVSQGLGCRGAMLRLGTKSEVWLLTLRRPEEETRTLPMFTE